mgnify:FL=1
MGKKDTITKNYIKRPDIFADVFNQFLYHGKQKIMPDRLTELDTTEIAVPYGGDNAFVPEQRYRDVAKLLAAMTDGRAAYCILAVENETKVNYAMPVKDGLYDFMQLAKQVTEAAAAHKKSKKSGIKPTSDEYLSGFWKSDRLLPVVTLVIYFGAEEWDGPMSLKEMYADCDTEIVKYAADYRINLIAPSRLSDEELDEFATSFREIMKYIKYSTDGEKLKGAVSSDERFKRVERQAVDVINVVTGSRVKYSKRKEMVDMCLAIQEIRKEGREEGRLEGELIGVIRAYRKMNVSPEDAKSYIMEEYKKSEEETDELLTKYWK